MKKIRRSLLCLLAAAAVLTGCDGKDPERLNRVGKKLAEKGRKAADDANLPKVTVSYPTTETPAKSATAAEKKD